MVYLTLFTFIGNFIISHKMMTVNSVTLFLQGLFYALFGLFLLYRVVISVMKEEYKGLYEKFGLNVVYYRKRKRLTQLQLAEKINVDRSHISAIELGNVGVSFDVIFKLCEVLEVKPKDLFDFRE